MSMTGTQQFFVDALAGALELGLGTPDDVLKHVTPDVLAAHLPRPLWAKLLAACLAAPRVDARLVVETIGFPDLCANVPGGILWNIVQDIAVRALGRGLVAAPPPPVVAEKPEKSEKPEKQDKKEPAKVDAKAEKAEAKAEKAAEKPAEAKPDKPAEKPAEKPDAAKAATPTPVPVTKSGGFARPPTGPVVAAPLPSRGSAPNMIATGTPPTGNRPASVTASQTAVPEPAFEVDIYDDDDEEPPPLDAPPVSHRAQTVVPGAPAPRPTGNTRPPTGAGASSRRPQARTAPRTTPPSPRRAGNTDFDLDTDVGVPDKDEKDVPVDDDQLVDWSASEETVTSGVEVDRKR